MYDTNKNTVNAFTFDNASEIFAGIHAYNESVYEAQEENDKRIENENKRAYDEAAQNYYNALYERDAKIQDRMEYLSKAKASFVTECLYKLLTNSCVTPLTENDQIIARNLCSRFVKEHGASTLLREFYDKNMLLSEFSRICDKAYGALLETEDEESEVRMNDNIAKEFFDDLEDVDMADASKMIKDKVSDSIANFMDDNVSTKLDYEEVIQSAKDQIDNADSEAQVESYNNLAKERIMEMENSREKSVFQCIVESMTKSALTNENIKNIYVEGSKVNMEKIVNSAELIYTMLEMLNTTNIVKMDDNFITEYVNSL